MLFQPDMKPVTLQFNYMYTKERHQNSGEIPYLYNVKIESVTPSPPLSLQANFTHTCHGAYDANIK